MLIILTPFNAFALLKIIGMFENRNFLKQPEIG
jgi:hypothetical protein